VGLVEGGPTLSVGVFRPQGPERGSVEADARPHKTATTPQPNKKEAEQMAISKFKNVGKRFRRVQALSNVTSALRKIRVHAIDRAENGGG